MISLSNKNASHLMSAACFVMSYTKTRFFIVWDCGPACTDAVVRMLFLFNLYSEELQTSTLRRSRRKMIIMMIIMKVDLPQPLNDDSYCFQNNVLWVFRSSLCPLPMCSLITLILWLLAMWVGNFTNYWPVSGSLCLITVSLLLRTQWFNFLLPL